jgi:hypothetical protein
MHDRVSFQSQFGDRHITIVLFPTREMPTCNSKGTDLSFILCFHDDSIYMWNFVLGRSTIDARNLLVRLMQRTSVSWDRNGISLSSLEGAARAFGTAHSGPTCHRHARYRSCGQFDHGGGWSGRVRLMHLFSRIFRTIPSSFSCCIAFGFVYIERPRSMHRRGQSQLLIEMEQASIPMDE